MMSKYRSRLPQLEGGVFLTDSGLETTLIFHDRLELPHFASIALMRTPAGVETLRQYFRRHVEIARANRMGFVFESATWRASSDWGSKLGMTRQELADANARSIDLMVELRDELETADSPMVISGNLGPRGDGYEPGNIMSPREAEAYHGEQIRGFSATAADMIAGFTLTNAKEAIGITWAAQKAGLPAAISFTLETDGRLPTGQALGEAIETVDSATRNGPAYYMINCAHPTHFDTVLKTGGDWIKRVRGIRANASKRSHAELNEAPDLDDGNPVELGSEYRDIRRRHPHINVLGGCCGTDHRHVEAIGHACRLAA